jgi:chromosome segregation ATPase
MMVMFKNCFLHLRHCAVNTFVLAALLIFGAAIEPQIAFAQKKTDAAAEQRRAEQLRKLSAQNQQLETEKAALVKEKESAQAGIKAGEEKVKAAVGRTTKLSGELAALRTKNTQLEQTAKSNDVEMQKLTAQLNEFKETNRILQTQVEERVQAIAVMTATNSKLQAQLKDSNELILGQKDRGQTLTSELGLCAKNNTSLVGLIDELSEKYRTKSCMDSRSLIEPLMGLRKAEFERVAEDYRGKAGDERYVRPVVPSASNLPSTKP